MEGRWTFLSPAWEDITGYSVAESLGRPALDFIHPDARAQHIADAQSLRAGEIPYLRKEYDFHRRDGSRCHVEVHIQPLLEDGHVVRLVGVLTDITEAVRFKAEREARQKMEEMLRLKESFLNNMSHELRTPLAAIIGFAELLSDEVEDDQKELVEPIVRGGQRLLRTVNSVLDLAQLESEGIKLHPELFDVTAEVRQTAQVHRIEADRKGLFLTVEGSAAPAVLDRSGFGRVLDNLVGNAIKFTEHGGVTVVVEGEGAGVRIHVTDTGSGIAPEFLPHVFGEFRQASEGLDREYEGNGLGLTIASRLVRLMGGTIGVESLPGMGATFTTWFPGIPAPGTQHGRSDGAVALEMESTVGA